MSVIFNRHSGYARTREKLRAKFRANRGLKKLARQLPRKRAYRRSAAPNWTEPIQFPETPSNVSDARCTFAKAIRVACYGADVADRTKWREVFDAEGRRWSSMSSDDLLSQLHDVQAYAVERDSKTYQVEVELLEDTDTYVHVMVGVDDRSLPASILPVTTSFIRQKPHSVR